MITVIFIAENGEPVQLRFEKNEALNETHQYGTWNVETNEIQLNEDGWRIFESNRNNIRNIKPMLDELIKSTAALNNF